MMSSSSEPSLVKGMASAAISPAHGFDNQHGPTAHATTGSPHQVHRPDAPLRGSFHESGHLLLRSVADSLKHHDRPAPSPIHTDGGRASRRLQHDRHSNSHSKLATDARLTAQLKQQARSNGGLSPLRNTYLRHGGAKSPLHGRSNRFTTASSGLRIAGIGQSSPTTGGEGDVRNGWNSLEGTRRAAHRDLDDMEADQ